MTAFLPDLASADPAPGQRPGPLSSGQRGLWFLDQLDPDGRGYLVQRAFEISGDVDVEALRVALSDAQNRHEALRSRFMASSRGPVQAPTAPPVHLRRIDVPADGDGAAVARDVMSADLMTRLDLAAGPPWRVSLATMAERRHVLVLTLHHIACDGRSLDVLCRDLGRAYAAHRRGEALPPPGDVQFRHFAAWEHDLLRSGALAADEAYWGRYVEASPGGERLPGSGSAVPSAAAEEAPVTLPAALLADARRLAGRARATTYMIFLTVWGAVLCDWAALGAVAVGMPASVRPPGFEHVVGFFVNTLPVHVPHAGSAPAADRVGLVRARVLDAVDHRLLPLERLRRISGRRPTLDRNPFFEATLDMAASSGSLSLGELACQPVPRQVRTARLPLELHLSRAADGVRGRVVAARPRLDAGTAATLAERFAAELSLMVREAP
jgi:hypothetical protein